MEGTEGGHVKAVEAGYWHKPWVMIFSTLFCDNCDLKEQDDMLHTSCHADLLYVNKQKPINNKKKNILYLPSPATGALLYLQQSINASKYRSFSFIQCVSVDLAGQNV